MQVSGRQLRVGEVAKATGLTVRALHHYDDIGLLVPSARSEAGYRLYSDGDVARLYRILALRAVGFTLEEQVPGRLARTVEHVEEMDQPGAQLCAKAQLLVDAPQVAADRGTRIGSLLAQRLADLITRRSSRPSCSDAPTRWARRACSARRTTGRA
jgi:DNA-binding transcriptional MerR regulator